MAGGEVAGERLGPFEPGGGRLGPKQSIPAHGQIIGQAGNERSFRADHDEVDRRAHGSESTTPGWSATSRTTLCAAVPGVARRHLEFGRRGEDEQRIRQGVFTPARTDQKDDASAEHSVESCLAGAQRAELHRDRVRSR